MNATMRIAAPQKVHSSGSISSCGVDDLGGSLVPDQAIQHQRAADPVTTQASRLLPLLHPNRRVHREATVAPGEEALHYLVTDLAALDEGRSTSARKSFST